MRRSTSAGERGHEPMTSFDDASCASVGDSIAAGVVGDAVFLLSFSFLDGPAPQCYAACDTNGDGMIAGDVGDAVHCLNFSFLGGPPPVDPFPNCGLGTRPTDATLGCAVPPANCGG